MGKHETRIGRLEKKMDAQNDGGEMFVTLETTPELEAAMAEAEETLGMLLAELKKGDRGGDLWNAPAGVWGSLATALARSTVRSR